MALARGSASAPVSAGSRLARIASAMRCVDAGPRSGRRSGAAARDRTGSTSSGRIRAAASAVTLAGAGDREDRTAQELRHAGQKAAARPSGVGVGADRPAGATAPARRGSAPEHLRPGGAARPGPVPRRVAIVSAMRHGGLRLGRLAPGTAPGRSVRAPRGCRPAHPARAPRSSRVIGHHRPDQQKAADRPHFAPGQSRGRTASSPAPRRR